MKLRIISDLHLDVDPSWRYSAVGEDAVLCAGDLAATKVSSSLIERAVASVSAPFFYVLGNHDAYHGSYAESIEYYRALEQRYAHFRLLHNEAVQLSGYRLVGTPLWTDFALRGKKQSAMDAAGRMISDFTHTVIGEQGDVLEPKHLLAWHDEARAFLEMHAAGETPTIVMTHWSPTGQATPKHFADSPVEPYFTSNCEELFGTHVPLWIHGHSHVFDDRMVNGTRLIRNPKGYPGENSNWRPDLVVELP